MPPALTAQYAIAAAFRDCRPSTPEYARVRPSTPEYARVRPSAPECARVRPSAPECARVPGHTRAYPGIPGHTRSYPVIPGHTRSDPVIPGHTRSYPVIPGHTRSYPGIPGHTRACPVIPGHTRSYPVIPSRGFPQSRFPVTVQYATEHDDGIAACLAALLDQADQPLLAETLSASQLALRHGGLGASLRRCRSSCRLLGILDRLLASCASAVTTRSRQPCPGACPSWRCWLH